MPEDLDGTLFRNGHAKFDVNVRACVHVWVGLDRVVDVDGSIDALPLTSILPTQNTNA